MSQRLNNSIFRAAFINAVYENSENQFHFLKNFARKSEANDFFDSLLTIFNWKNVIIIMTFFIIIIILLIATITVRRKVLLK